MNFFTKKKKEEWNEENGETWATKTKERKKNKYLWKEEREKIGKNKKGDMKGQWETVEKRLKRNAWKAKKQILNIKLNIK